MAGRRTNVAVVLCTTNRTNQVAGKIAGNRPFKFKRTLVIRASVLLLVHVVETIENNFHYVT
jgi:hypothetical protein